MTPEQKAFFVYGRSRGWLKAHRSKRYFVDVPDMGLHAWHVERDMHGLDALIRDAWRKRAVCRVLKATGGRCCSNCLYKNRLGNRRDSFQLVRPCSMCEEVTHWQPIQEERE